MARRSKKKGEQKEKGQPGRSEGRPGGVPRKRTLPNWPLLGLSLAGIGLTAYLFFSSWFGAAPLYCGEGSSCDIVQHSRWGTFLGIPTSAWGLLTYAAIAYIALRVRNPERHWKFSWTIALTGFAYSVYLTVISFAVIETACIYCLVSLALMGAVVVTVGFQRPGNLKTFGGPSWAGQTVFVAVMVVAGMHLHYSGLFDAAAGPEDPYLEGLAEHLADSGAIFYGAYW